jgi:hypothetical protein
MEVYLILNLNIQNLEYKDAIMYQEKLWENLSV